jgi:Gas vesicle synthesis protein GvpL/GvpF
MTVLLYAVTEANVPLVGHGLEGRPLRAIPGDELAAVVSDHEQPPAPSEPNLWAYEQVVERLMARATVLPARFGSTVERDEQLEQVLAERRLEFRQTLDQVRGAVEIAIRAPASDAAKTPVPAREPNAPSSGTEYMLARLAQHRRAGELAEQIDAAVGELARARTRRATSPNTLAYLVEHEQVDEFIARLERLGDADTTWSGPWPPYSFIGPAGTAS